MLVWIDLEMTGLNPQRDHILEIASLITTNDLKLVAEGPHLVVHQPESHLAFMEEPVITMHRKNGLLEEVRQSAVSIEDASSQTLDFIKSYIHDVHSSPLCGNSVWADRRFLEKYMPKVHKYLHYRCLDVSTVKELAIRWLGKDFVENGPKKPDNHRAKIDVACSVEELQYYRDNFFTLPVPV